MMSSAWAPTPCAITPRRRAGTLAFFDLEPYAFEMQRAYWGEAMLNADSEVVAFGDVQFEGERFIRPVDDTKSFAGAVSESNEFAEWRHRVVALGEDVGSTLTRRTVVQVSSPKAIRQEVRCWMVRGPGRGPPRSTSRAIG